MTAWYLIGVIQGIGLGIGLANLIDWWIDRHAE